MKSLVLFYSYSGNTRRIAQMIAEKSGADLRELLPIESYPSDYAAATERARAEIRRKYRPPLHPVSMDWSQYEVIYLGTPNWCDTMAPPLSSFLWEQMPTDKAIVPFCTHGGSGAGRIAHDIADYCIGCNVLPILSICNDGGPGAEKEVDGWLKRIFKILELSSNT